MARELVSIAEAVREELQTAQDADTFAGPTWRAERSYADWDLELATTDGVRVDVVLVGNGVVIEQQTQTGVAYFVPIDIAVRKKLRAEDDYDGGGPSILSTTVLDELVDLVEHIAEYFATPSRRLTTYTNAVFDAVTIITANDKTTLREMRQFTGVVRVTLRSDKELSP